MSAELKPGYKQTEVGVIPEDWEAARLGDKTTKVGSGITPTGGERVYKQEGRPFLRSQNVGWGTLILDDIAFIDEDTHAKFQDTEIEICDVFLNITGASIGRSAVADCRVKRGNVNQHVCIIRTNQVQLHPRFLNYFLLSTAGQKQIESFQAGGNRQGLNFGQIRSFLIPLPPTKAEQEVIAEALSDADALIESLEQLIAKKRHLKQGAMQELLTDKKRLPGFSGEWERKRLGDVAEIVMGQSPSSSYYNYKDDGLPLIQGNADIANRKTIKRVFTTEITKRGRRGDILMSVRAPVGEISRAIFDVCLGRGVWAIRYANDFLYHSLIAKESTWAKLSKGSTFDSVNSTDVKAFKIGLPIEYEEQIAIATIFSDMDAEIAALEAKLAKARQVKQGMMQELLTGKTRLV